MNLCIDTMQSFFGKFKLDQGVSRCKMICHAEVNQNFVMDDFKDLSCLRLHALENIEANKLRIARYYD